MALTLRDAVSSQTSHGVVLRETLARALADPYLRSLLALVVARTGALGQNALLNERPIDPLALAYNEGWRAAGLELLDMFMAVDPMAYANMVSDVLASEAREQFGQQGEDATG